LQGATTARQPQLPGLVVVYAVARAIEDRACNLMSTYSRNHALEDVTLTVNWLFAERDGEIRKGMVSSKLQIQRAPDIG